MIDKLKGGIENKVYRVSIFSKSFVLKIISKKRFKHDGGKIIARYVFLNKNKISKTYLIIPLFTQLLLLYEYVPGNVIYKLTHNHLELLSKKLYNLHNVTLPSELILNCKRPHISLNTAIVDDKYKETINILNYQAMKEKSSLGFIHGDFHPGNIIWDDEKCYFIDWDNCGCYYTEYDIACFRLDIALIDGIDQAESFYNYYCLLSGKKASIIYQWDLYVILSQSIRYKHWIKPISNTIGFDKNYFIESFNKWAKHVFRCIEHGI